MKKLLSLYGRFFIIGLLTFGGGYSMLPMMQRELIDKQKWVTKDELLDYFAVSQCTPGIISVNTATFVGSKVGGFWGSVFATLGVITPSLLIILAIAAFLWRFMEIEAVRYAFNGIRIAVAGLIIAAVAGLVKQSIKGWLGISIASVVFICSLVFNLSPIIFVLASAFIGIAIQLAKRKAGSKNG